MNKKYRPSNGTEGDQFINRFCDHCAYEKFIHTSNSNDLKCEILSKSLLYNINEAEYPEEWQYNSRNKPICTQYKKYDWNKDVGEKEPPSPPEPENPNQLVLPFIMDEILENRKKLIKNLT
jgi:hypothetical protein